MNKVWRLPSRQSIRAIGCVSTGLGGRDSREITAQHRGSRDERHDVRRGLCRARVLICGEKEDLVLDHWSAEHAPELIPDQAIACALAGRRIDRSEGGGCVEAMVA